VEWQTEVGLQRGLVFNTDSGLLSFEAWPLVAHEAMVHEFAYSFSKQLLMLWDGSQFDPVFEGVGSSCKPPNIIWN